LSRKNAIQAAMPMALSAGKAFCQLAAMKESAGMGEILCEAALRSRDRTGALHRIA
jgi:hypothetical protein